MKMLFKYNIWFSLNLIFLAGVILSLFLMPPVASDKINGEPVKIYKNKVSTLSEYREIKKDEEQLIELEHQIKKLRKKIKLFNTLN